MSNFKLLYRSITAAILAIALGGCGGQKPPLDAPQFTYESDKALSDSEREIETRFGTAIADNLNVFVAAYRSQWPKIVNTDNARELFQDYAPDGFDLTTERNKERRTKYALGTQAPARALAMEVYRRMLAETPKAGEAPLVVFTAGGAGSGKSTSVSSVVDLLSSVNQAQIIVDTTLSGDGALQQIKMALDAGKDVKIFYIYREPELAFEGVLERAIRTGRPVTVSNFVATHLGAVAALDSVANLYAPQIAAGKVDILVVNNSGAIGEAKLEDRGVAFLRQQVGQRSRGDLENKCKNQLRTAYENGLISRELYDKSNR